jgi:hypothetical protein
VLGSLYLLAFSGGLVALWDLPKTAGNSGSCSFFRVKSWTWGMTILVWLTVLVGTYVVYPWYRAKPAAGTTGAALTQYPRSLLLSNPHTAEWHEFGMEWKEHIAWLSPILATAVAVVVTLFPRNIATDARLRSAVVLLFTAAFLAASVSGLFGALINKAAPVH